VTLTLEGRRALVGGGSQGIGRGSAEALAGDGASVTLLARNSETLESTRDNLPTPVGQHHGFIAVDFASWEDVRGAAGADVAANGPRVHLGEQHGRPKCRPDA
jgi:3-oxoacyl-[acyl-carrier protein] reductase